MASRGDPLLTSKFHADEIRPGPINRPRLFEALDVAARGPLTLVTAPAGAGKTTLVSSWVAAGRAPGRVTWITLDPGDHRPEIFWSYVLEGLARSDIELTGIGPTVVGGRVVGSLLARLSACLAAQPVPSVLILDNVEQLGRGPVANEIEFLIRHTIPQLRVIVIGRGSAPLPLHHYRLAGWVSRIDMADLAFTGTETRALLAEHGVRIPDSGVAILAERTRGWAAGIRLAALSLRGKPAAEAARVVRRFDGSRPDVAEYLVAEVLDRWPPVVRQFLMRTSVVDTVHPNLAEALSGRQDSAALLFALARANAFVTVSEDGSYHYHPLLRGLLRHRLDRAPTEAVAGLHRSAAHWFADAGQPVAAVRHAAAAGDWAWAADLVIDRRVLVRLFAGSDSEQHRELLAGMPDTVDGAAPDVVRTMLAIARNDARSAADYLSRASMDSGGPSVVGGAPVRLAVNVARTLLGALRLDVVGTVSAATAVEGSAAELAALGSPIPPELRATVLAAKGAALLWSGDLGGADGALVAASRAAAEAGFDELKMRVLGQLALLNAIRGRLRQATRFGRLAVNIADRLGRTEKRRPVVIDAAFAWIYADTYDIRSARSHLRTTTPEDDPLAAAALAVVQGRLRCGAGPLRVSWPATIEPPPWLASLVHDPSADLDGASTLVARVAMWLHTAARELDQGRTEPATRALCHALKLAEPENLRRPIMEAPPGLRRLLRGDPELSGRHQWLGGDPTGTAPAESGPEPHRPILVEQLTNREHEVLRNMAALLSTDEIAGTMFVSVNTVKTHVRGILRKLCVNRRNDAIRRARELGLV